MHDLALKEVVWVCRQRQREGDCPTVEALAVEVLEDAVCQLSRQVEVATPAEVKTLFSAEWVKRKVAAYDEDPIAGPDICAAEPTDVAGLRERAEIAIRAADGWRIERLDGLTGFLVSDLIRDLLAALSPSGERGR